MPIAAWKRSTAAGSATRSAPANCSAVVAYCGPPAALIASTIIKIFTGRAKEVSVLTYVISALFLVKFFLVV